MLDNTTRPRADLVLDAVRTVTGFTPDDLRRPCRAVALANARHIAVVHLRRQGLVWLDIAALLHRTHAACLSAARRHDALYTTDPAFRLLSDSVSRLLH